MKPTEHLTITERPGTYITVMSDSSGSIIVVSDGPGARASRYTPEEAAKLGLAILEAAGVKPVGYPGNSTITLGSVAGDLALVIAEQERATAEARELAELEAEALELLNAEREEFSCTPVRDLSEVPARDQRAAIAVARRAREIATDRSEVKP